jgi:hypothetical protein
MTTGPFATSIRPKLGDRFYAPVGLLVCVDGTMYPGAPFPPIPGNQRR